MFSFKNVRTSAAQGQITSSRQNIQTQKRQNLPSSDGNRADKRHDFLHNLAKALGENTNDLNGFAQ